MKRNRKRKKSKLIPVMLCLLCVSVVLCAGAMIGVIYFTGNEKTLVAPQVPTPAPVKTATPTVLIQTEEPEKTEAPQKDHKEEYQAPEFTKASASSVREAHSGENVYITYVAKNVLDGNKKTTWTPSPDDKYPWIKLTAQTTQTITGLEIENGYSKSEKLYEENRRAKEITVLCGGKEYEFTLDDAGCGVAQKVKFQKPVESKEIKITVTDFYEGTEYEELCISGIKAY